MPSVLIMCLAYEALARACDNNRSSKQAEARELEGKRAHAAAALLARMAKTEGKPEATAA